MAKKKWEIWPIGIVVAMASFITGIVVAVTVMVNNDVPLVSDDYYSQEIAYQGRIDKEQRVVAHGRKPALKYLPNTDAMELTLAGYSPEAPPTGKLTFFRPSNPGKDFSLDLKPGQNGTQWVDLRSVDGGLWVVQLDWTESGHDYYYEQRMTL